MSIEPTIEHYRDFAVRFEGGFLDYYFQGILCGDDGNDYFLIYALARMGTGFDLARIEISTEPLWFLTTPFAKIIQKGEKPEIRVGGYQPMGSVKTRPSSAALIAYCDTFETVCTPPTYAFRYQGNTLSLDITLNSLGIPFWYNREDEGARITPSSICWGLELIGEAKGTITIEGKKIHVEGVGLHEHVILEHINWLEYGWHNWAWFLFDEMYGLIQETQHLDAFQSGGIYFRDEKRYFEVTKLDIENFQWAFSPVLQHDFPIGTKIRARTDKGTILIEGDALRTQPWNKIDRYSPGVNLCATEMEMNWRGSFTFKDGRNIKLEDGKGVNEVIGTFNYVGSNR